MDLIDMTKENILPKIENCVKIINIGEKVLVLAERIRKISSWQIL